MNKREAGQRGGQRTVQKHGKDYMRTIGKRGADATWRKYNLVPTGTSQWAMVDRITGEVKAIW